MVNTQQLYEIYLQHPAICTDSRKITPGCLYFALRGDNFDGNDFVKQALEKGAAYAIADKKTEDGSRVLLVENGLKALQDLARHHRQQLKIPVIGITGSNGKTTTKELLYSVLSQHCCTFATQGNLNNHIGVPLSILSINSEHQMAIIEMGANHQKEIEFLCGIAQPSHGLITNIGKAHLDGFGGIEGVKKGKGELYAYLAKTNGTVFINRDSPDLMNMNISHRLKNIVYYGRETDNYISGRILDESPFLKIAWQKAGAVGCEHELNTRLTGFYNLENLLAAIAVGCFFGVEADEINEGISHYVPNNNRSQITETTHNTLICDYYNANPSSILAALENLKKLPADRKAIILGDMYELGEESPKEHADIIQKALNLKTERCIFIGKDFYDQKGGYGGEFYAGTPDACEALKKHPLKGATILVKGSRGMRLENLIEFL